MFSLLKVSHYTVIYSAATVLEQVYIAITIIIMYGHPVDGIVSILSQAEYLALGEIKWGHNYLVLIIFQLLHTF